VSLRRFLAALPCSLSVQAGRRKTAAHPRAPRAIVPSRICPQLQQLLPGSKRGTSPAEVGSGVLGASAPTAPLAAGSLRIARAPLAWAVKRGELNNSRDVEVTLPSPPLSAWGNLKPRQNSCPKFSNTLPSQEMCQVLSIILAKE